MTDRRIGIGRVNLHLFLYIPPCPDLSMDIDNATAKTSTMPLASQDDDYGTDIELDEELEGLLFNAESQVLSAAHVGITSQLAEATPATDQTNLDDRDNVMDIEDIVEAGPSNTSPFEEFRPKGRLSVTDLVGLVWCEVQVGLLPYVGGSSADTGPV